MLKSIMLAMFKLMPENALKNRMRFYYRNCNQKNFRTGYKNNYFQFRFKTGFAINSYDDIFYDLENTLDGYLADYKLKEGDVIVDCGAYAGEFTLYAAIAVGNTGKVIAFEPDSQNYERLVNNIKLNNLTNVIAVPKGVWSQNTVLGFNNSHSGVSSFLFDGKAESTINVPVVRLDDELSENGIRKVDFIKMDIEGAEIEAIKGAKRVLESNDVHLAIASYHIVNGEKSCFELEKLLSSFGYSTRTSFPKHLTTYALRIEQEPAGGRR